MPANTGPGKAWWLKPLPQMKTYSSGMRDRQPVHNHFNGLPKNDI